MKKITALLLSLLLVVSFLAACADGIVPEKTNDGGKQTEDPKTDAPAESPIAALSANHTLTNAEMTYIYYGVFSDFYQHYSDYLSYLGLDMEKSMKEQTCMLADEGDDMTWFEYFIDGAHAYAEQYLVLAEAADAAGKTVTDEMRESVRASIDSLKSLASDNGYASFEQYLAAYYKNGVTEKYIENVLLLSAYATAYSREVYNAYEFTEDEIKAYCDKNLSDKTDYRYVNVRHILVDTEAEAKEILAQILKADDVEAEFAKTAGEKTKDPGSKSTGGLYTNVYVGQMVPAFNDWCFDESRKPGDTGIVSTDYGYHIMYFSGYGDSYFESTAISELRRSAYNRQYNRWLEQYPVTFNDELINSIDA